ncbi:MAG: hypothetical protein WDA22_17500 [Bacteroidota bacterium]
MEEEQTKNRRKKYLRFLAVWAIISVFFFVELVCEAYPNYPKKTSEWFLLLLIGPPVWIAGEYILERFLSKPIEKVFRKLGEERLKTINKILALIIAIPIAVMVLILLSIYAYEVILNK